MSPKPDGGAAFPEIETDLTTNSGGADYPRTYSYGGMSLRDYFAAKALNGMLSSDAHPDVILESLMASDEAIASRARFAYAVADAMIAERNK